MPLGLEPWSGSVNPKQPIISPEANFGKYYIGQHPTKAASTYLILNFNFSGIDTKSDETTYRDFLRNVKIGVVRLLDTYSDLLPDKRKLALLKLDTPQAIVQELFHFLQTNTDKTRI